MRRSLAAAEFIPRGTRLMMRHIVCKRPGTGIAPRDLTRILGRTTRRAIAADLLIRLDWLR
jgi:sialic acid synthase SpsE